MFCSPICLFDPTPPADSGTFKSAMLRWLGAARHSTQKRLWRIWQGRWVLSAKHPRRFILRFKVLIVALRALIYNAELRGNRARVTSVFCIRFIITVHVNTAGSFVLHSSIFVQLKICHHFQDPDEPDTRLSKTFSFLFNQLNQYSHSAKRKKSSPMYLSLLFN